MKGQANVGGLVALLILIAIGAVVLYEITGTLVVTNPSKTLSMAADNSPSTSATLGITDSISSATLATTLSSENIGRFGSTTIIVQLNGENIIVATNENISTAENTVSSYAVKGTNTITITNDNGTNFLTGSSTLNVTTYAGSAVGKVESRGYTSFNLLTILAIVIVAALIIAVVVGSIGGGIGTKVARR